MHGLTPQQRAIVTFVEEYSNHHSYAPSYREIASHFGWRSLGSVYKHIQTLIEKGALKSLKRQSRSLAATEQNVKTEDCLYAIPLIGVVRRGEPIEMLSSPQQVMLPTGMVTDHQITYLLRIGDNALHEELIAENDLLMIETRPPTDEGELILGIVNGQEILVKRFYRQGEYIRLEGEHANHMPMILSADYLEVLGLVRGVLRHYQTLPHPHS